MNKLLQYVMLGINPIILNVRFPSMIPSHSFIENLNKRKKGVQALTSVGRVTRSMSLVQAKEDEIPQINEDQISGKCYLKYSEA